MYNECNCIGSVIDVYFMNNAMIATSSGGNVSGSSRGSKGGGSRVSASSAVKLSSTVKSRTVDGARVDAAESDIAVLQQMLDKLLLVPQRELEFGMIDIPTKCMMTMDHIGNIIVMH